MHIAALLLWIALMVTVSILAYDAINETRWPDAYMHLASMIVLAVVGGNYLS